MLPDVALLEPPRHRPLRRGAGALACAALLLVVALVAPASAPARERGADGRFDRRRSAHFLLLQDVDIDHRSGSDGARRFERDVLEVLESAYERVADDLGIRPRSDIRVHVYDDGVFDASFGSTFGFRAAGFFDGIIHVRAGARVDPRLVRTLHHEYVHAALLAEAGPGLFPAWLNEGLAEYFENLAVGKRGLSRGESAVLVRAARSDVWIPVGALSGVSFTHLEEQSAGLAYLEAYAFVVYLVDRGGMGELRRFCERFIRSRNLERALRDAYGVDLAGLEAALLDVLR